MTGSNPEKTQRLLGLVLMVIVAFIWGSIPVAIKEIIASFSVAVQICIRFTIGAVILTPFAFQLNWQLLRDGLIVGLLQFAAITTETIGLETLAANQAAFVYGLIVVMVALFDVVFRRSLSLRSLLATVLAFAGIAFMGWDNGPPPIGEFWLILCAFFSAANIITLEIFVARHSPLSLTWIQLTVISVLCWLWVAPELSTNFDAIANNLHNSTNLGFMLYLGIVGTTIVTWFQIMALRRITAFEAGLLESLEPIFGAILAFLFLGETFGRNGWIGAWVVLVAMFLALSQKKSVETGEEKLEEKEDPALAEIRE